MTEPQPLAPGTHTFLFSDIEGSTSLERAIGARPVRGSPRAASGHRPRGLGSQRRAGPGHGGRLVLRRLPREHGGRSPPPSPRSGRSPRNRGRTDAPIRIRIGISTGDADQAGDSYVGLGVNRAARIAAVAAAARSSSRARRATSYGDNPIDGVTLRDLGDHRLKDLGAPVRIYQVEADGLQATFPPLRTLDARPNNLPTQLTTFVGRDDELAEAARLLADDAAADADRPRRHGQDPALAPVGGPRLGRLPGRGLLRPPRADPRPDARPAADRAHGRRDRKLDAIDRGDAGGLAAGQASAARPRQLRAGPSGGGGGRRPPAVGAGRQDRHHQPRGPARVGRTGVPGAGPADTAGSQRDVRARTAQRVRRARRRGPGRARRVRRGPPLRRAGDGGPTGLRGDDRERAGRCRDQRTPAGHAARHRARRRAGQDPVARCDPRPARPAAGRAGSRLA